MTQPKNIGEQLRDLREAAGLSLAEVARRAGTAAANVIRVESDRDGTTYELISRILGAMGYGLGVFRSEGETDHPRVAALGTDTCEHLARIGLAALGGDHGQARGIILGKKPEPRDGGYVGAKWVRLITWPDRLPGLKTWAGQSSLPKIITAHQRRLRESTETDLFAVRGKYRTAKKEGPSGLDAMTCMDSVDIGFSPSALGLDIECRPAVELLAIIGLEVSPIISYGPREFGILGDDSVWKFRVEPRDGGYYYRISQKISFAA